MKSKLTLLLGTLAIAIFLTECWVFHFSFAVGLDALSLAALILLPGVLAVLLLKQFAGLAVNGHEVLSLGAPVGFGIMLLLLNLLGTAVIGCGNIILIGIPVSSVMLFLLLNSRFALLDGLTFRMELRDSLILLNSVLLFFAAFNLQQFHYRADGAILTRGLFGVDIPFLAGQVHGIRDFGALRDLNQNALSWHYHDAIYRLLALLPRGHTVDDIILAAPLVGYVLLAYSVFTIVLRLTQNNYSIAWLSVAAWFLAGSIPLSEIACAALSPSFVFGNVLLVNAIIIVDLLLLNRGKSHGKWTLVSTLFFLLIVLSTTKLSADLVLVLGALIFGLVLWKRKQRGAFEIFLAVILSVIWVGIQTTGASPFMPSADFLIGAPLLGYGNHLATILHLPVHSLNPVSNEFHLRWQSLLLIPYSLFYLLWFTLTNPKVLAAVLTGTVIAFSLLRRRSRTGRIVRLENDANDRNDIGPLLLILMPLGAVLPILYSPAWYALALSNYAPIVSVQAALLWTATNIRGARAGLSPTGSSLFRWAVILLFAIGVLQSVQSIFLQIDTHYDTVQPSFIEAMNYLLRQEPDSAIVATHRYYMVRDQDEPYVESQYWYAALSGHPVISEGAMYGALLAAVCDTNSEKGLHRIPAAQALLAKNRALLDSIFLSGDSGQVRSALTRGNVAFVIEDRTVGQYLHVNPQSIGVQVFSNEACTIWKVR